MKAWPTLREKLVSLWHALVDYDRKIPDWKREMTAKKRVEAKEARLMIDHKYDSANQRKRDARNQAAENVAAYERSLPPDTYICVACESIGHPIKRIKGSLAVEIVMWLMFCAPGIIYSVWRMTSAEWVCKFCGHVPIPVRTPRGTELWEKTKGR